MDFLTVKGLKWDSTKDLYLYQPADHSGFASCTFLIRPQTRPEFEKLIIPHLLEELKAGLAIETTEGGLVLKFRVLADKGNVICEAIKEGGTTIEDQSSLSVSA